MPVPAKAPAEKKMASIDSGVFRRWATGFLLALNLRCIGSFPLPLGQNDVLTCSC